MKFKGDAMKWIYIIYLLVSSLLMFGVLIYNFLKPRHVSVEPPLRMLFFFGGLSVVLNVGAMMASSERMACALFSMYYFATDVMLLGVVSFVRRYTGLRNYEKKLQVGMTLLADVDAVLMLINYFTPIMFHCESIQDEMGNLIWHVAQRESLYFYHIGFTFLAGFVAMFDLIRKIIRSPKIYKVKYAVILILACIIAIVHSAYLQLDYRIDYSLFWVSIITLSIYYYSMIYVPHGLIDRLMFFTVANMKDGIVCLDLQGKCVHANKAAKIYCNDEIDEQVKKWFEENITSEKEYYFWKDTRKIANETRHYEIEYRKMFDVNEKNIGCFFIIKDCTVETNRLAAEKYRATHDALTGIYNKEYFYDKVKKLFEENPETEYCIVCTDVKNFKIINDVFGVEVGDKLLMRIASAIRFMAKDGWIFGRLTGDRFSICLPKKEFDESEFMHEISKMCRLSENYIFKIQIHMGVYFIEDKSLRISIMCDRANLAIRTVKESYQNSVAYYKETLREDFLNEQKLISEFDIALRSGQFHPYIQPQVFSEDGKIRGGEVLVRWIHPQSGMIPPYKFIPVFEQTGLIGRLDSYMWEQACIKLQEWQRKGFTDQYLSVNISQKDFYLLDVYQTVTSLIEKYQLSPKQLHLEITETAIMNNPQEQLPLISRLREYGFMIEIDDFGSGYSSLNTLKDMKADVLKIDMGFLRKTANQERSKIILKMVVSLAKSLQMEVITEGVETQEQVDFLKDYGCDIFQGYHFAKPMPVRDFEENFLNQTVQV